MILKIIKPNTPTQRHLIQVKNENLRKTPLLKKFIKGKKTINGRNNSGKITIRHKGGGHKTKYRNLNFKRINESTGIITSIEYDPNRNANIASVFDLSANTFFYMLAPKNIKLGDIVKSGTNIEAKLGYSLPVGEIPVGSLIHSISTIPGRHSKISRAAGTFSKLKEVTLMHAKIELNSGEQLLISQKCYASIGVVSNELHSLTQLGKAGRARWLNRRPTVRGVAMNPVDHPHGGGEGKKSGKGKTPWGKNVKKGLTRKSKKYN